MRTMRKNGQTSNGLNILVITGDKSFKPGHPRFDLQAGAVDRFEAVYWGPASLWPKLDVRHQVFDVVTSQDPFFRGLFAWLISKRLNAKFNVQVHADIKEQWFLKRIIASVVLQRAHSIRVVSLRLKEQVLQLLPTTGYPLPTISTLPIFVDVEKFKAVVRQPAPEPTILWIGRFEDEKDPLRAVSVFREVLEKIPEAKMVMLGEGSMRKEIEKEADTFPVELPGWQDPVSYLERAHVVLSTSKAESWGASIVEALASGVPVVAPDVGIAKEAGSYVVPRSELANKVIEVLKANPEMALKIKPLSKEEWLNKWKESLQ